MQCNICLLTVNKEENPPTLCGHYFHKNCLCEWLNSTRHLSHPPTCPTCRGDISFERAQIEYYQVGNKKVKCRIYIIIILVCRQLLYFLLTLHIVILRVKKSS